MDGEAYQIPSIDGEPLADDGNDIDGVPLGTQLHACICMVAL